MKKQKDAQKRKEKKQKNIKVVEDDEEEEKEEEKDDEEEILNRTQWDPGKDATTTQLTDLKNDILVIG